MRVVVIGVQGDVEEHVISAKIALKKLKINGEVIATRRAGVIRRSDVIIIPGGESTTISKLIWEDGIAEEIIEAYEEGKPIMGTCAGLIILSRYGDEQVEKTKTKLLGLLDVKVKRNAFGRQRESFEVDLDVKGIGKYRAIFIRAPVIVEVGKEVDVLATFKDKIVAVRQEKVLGLAFHPELTGDTRIHEYLIKLREM
uniref:Pyridoxal 5'-phosphate synthase subunit PdxT n=1 Tax=Geoglobus ahangari TaxID=113653 RepID=A0A7C3YG61_9EURY